MSSMGDIVANLRLNLSDFNSSMERASSQISQLGSNTQGLQSFANGLTSIGTKMTLGLTVPLTAFGASCVKTTSQFQSSMSNVRALISASSKDVEGDMAKLTNIAKEMGATTKFSASEAADALGYMALAGWNANQSCDALPGVLDLAAASGMGLAEASDMVTDYLSAFGQEAGQAGHMADVLAKAQATSNTSAQQLGEAFKNCAVNANSFGLDIEQTTALLGKLADQGLKGSEAGTALNAVFRDITANMKNGAIQIGHTSVKVTDANGNFRSMTDIIRDVNKATDSLSESEKMAAMQSTFTAYSIKAMGILCNTGADKIGEMTDSLYNCDGAASDMAKTMNDNLNGDIASMKSAFEALQITIGEALTPCLRKLVQFITKVFSALSKLPAPVVGIITIIGAVVAAIGPLLVIMGTLMGSILKIREGWQALQIMRNTGVFTNMIASLRTLRTGFIHLYTTMRQEGVFTLVSRGFRSVLTSIKILATNVGGKIIGAFKSLWAVMLAHPFVTIAVAITALVAGFIYLWNNCEGFRNFFINMWEAIKTAVSQSSATIKMAFKDLVATFQSVYNFFKTLFEGIGKLFNDLKNGNFKGFVEDFKKLGEDLKGCLQDIIENFGNLLVSGCDALQELFSMGLAKLLDPVINWGYNISGALGDAMVDLYGVLEDIFNLITEYWRDTIQIIMALIQGDWEGACALAQNMWENLCDNMANILEDLSYLIPDLFNGMIDLINAGIDKLGDVIIEWGYSISGSVGDAMVDLYGFISDVFNSLVDLVQDVGKLLYDIFTGNWSNIGNDVSQIIQNLVKNIGLILGDLIYLVGDIIASIGDALANGIKNLTSPIIQWGNKINQSLGKALFNMSAIVQDTFTMIATVVRDALGIIASILQGDWQGAINGFKVLCEDLLVYAKIIFNDIKQLIFNSIKATIELIWQGIQSFGSKIVSWCSQTLSKFTKWAGNVVSSVGEWFTQLPEKIGYILGLIIGVIASWCVNTYNTFIQGISTAINGAIQWFNTLPQRIGYALGFALGVIVSWGINTFNYFATNIPLWIDSISLWFSQLPQRISTWLINTYNNIVNWGISMYNKAIETGQNFINGIVQFIQQLPGMVQSFFTQAYNNSINWANNMKNKAIETGQNFINGVSEFFRTLPSRLQNWFNQAIQNATKWVSSMVQKGQQAGSQFIQKVSSFIQQLPGKIANWFSQTISKASNFVSQFGQKATQAGKNFTTNIVNGVKSIPSKMVSIGKNIVKGIWSGITGMGGWLKSQISNFASGVVKGFKSGFKINSPSKIMRDVIGTGIVEGIAVGMNNEEPSLLKGAKEMATNLVNTMNNSISPEMVASLVSGDTSLSQATNNTNDKWKELLDVVKNSNGGGTITVNLNIDNFNNQRNTDIKGLMEEMTDVIKGAQLVRNGNVVITG